VRRLHGRIDFLMEPAVGRHCLMYCRGLAALEALMVALRGRQSPTRLPSSCAILGEGMPGCPPHFGLAGCGRLRAKPLPNVVRASASQTRPPHARRGRGLMGVTWTAGVDPDMNSECPAHPKKLMPCASVWCGCAAVDGVTPRRVRRGHVPGSNGFVTPPPARFETTAVIHAAACGAERRRCL
jgi:hypothetical protein